MKLEIYNEQAAEESVVRLTLRKSDIRTGEIVLCAVGKNGLRIPSGNLLSITASGGLRLHGSIDPKLGFVLDREYRLIMEEG